MSSNGSNPRLDRIERLIEQSERANKEAHARSEQAHARHEREMAEIRELARKTREESRRFRDDLRRWAALGVKEARNQRMRQREIDLNITRLSAGAISDRRETGESDCFPSERTKRHRSSASRLFHLSLAQFLMPRASSDQIHDRLVPRVLEGEANRIGAATLRRLIHESQRAGFQIAVGPKIYRLALYIN
jgi:hypothetical protein